jgi:hypothetical protein
MQICPVSVALPTWTDRHMTGCQCLITVIKSNEKETIKNRFPKNWTADVKRFTVECPPKIYKIQQN